jgi:serine protease Do
LDHFDLQPVEGAQVGTRVLAFSNLYGVAAGNEPASVQHGVIAALTRLEARRGVFETPYRGPVYVLDAITNNPGAAGGALTDRRGRLLGMLGKELRNAQSNTWLNYAVPVEVLREALPQLRQGRVVQSDAAAAIAPEEALSPELLGLVLVPDVLERTPPFIDVVRPESAAARAGLLPDDLVLFVNDRLVQTCKALRAELQRIDRLDSVRLTVIRGQQLIEVQLTAPEPSP